MSTLCRPFEPTLATRDCTFKLYGRPLPDRGAHALHGLALTWIVSVTAGFVRAGEGSPIISIYWWKEQALRRLRCDPRDPGLRPNLDAFTVAYADELPLLAFEAGSWTRHVVQGRPPSMPAYLAEFHS